jgi:site-specific recombinase XerD
MSHPIPPLLKRFFSHYLPVQRGLSVNTVQAYRDAVKLLLCYTADRLHRSADELFVEDVAEEVVLGFLDAVETERGCSKRTRNARLAGIRSLFAFIAREEPALAHQSQQIRTIPLKRMQHKTVDYLKESEMQAEFEAVDVDTRTGIRDQALLMVLYNTGARVSEIVNLELADLRLDKAPQITLHGKGNKDRTCPLWRETVAVLKAYLERRIPRTPGATHVFLNANGDPITRFGIRYVTRKYGAIAGSQRPGIQQKPVNPHRIRHTTAMHLLRAGNDLNMVSYWLGHANLNTTHIYVEIDMETKQKMLEKTSAPTVSKAASWHRPSVLQWLRNLA